MDPSLAAAFATACRAEFPLELVIEHADGPVVAAGTLEHPFALLGREPDCDVHLDHPSVCGRHAFLQVIDGQVFVGDLGSRGGLWWADGPRPHGWLVPGRPVGVGPFKVGLAKPVSGRPLGFGPDFHPLAGGGVPDGARAAAVEFRSGQTDRTVWEVNRAITLVGRGRGCKIQLTGDDVSPYHCYLVRGDDGLWAVDLLSRTGTRVDGQPVRAARLEHDSEVEVGAFRLGCVYPPVPEDNGDGLVSFDVPERRSESAQVLLSATPPELRSAGARLHGSSTMTAPNGVLSNTHPAPPGALSDAAWPLAGRSVGHTTPPPRGSGPLAGFDRAVAALPAEYQAAFAAVRAELAAALRTGRQPQPTPTTIPPPDAPDRQLEVWERIARLEAEKASGWKRLFGRR